MEIPTFHTKEDLFKWLQANKSTIIQHKKCAIKHADSICYSAPTVIGEDVNKEVAGSVEVIGKINAVSVINTTGLLDSHGDVHIKGLWKKSLSEKKGFLLLQEHQQKFNGIISDEVKASAINYTWKDLGFNYDGSTEALIFNSTISADRNPYMFEQYAKNRVKNHSVGMRYITMFLCINSDQKWYAEEKENYDKYIKQVANKEDAESLGYFWAVTEAQIVEGSAVVFGSNYATPTISVTEIKNIEPLENTQHTEPGKATQNKIDYSYLSKSLKS